MYSDHSWHWTPSTASGSTPDGTGSQAATFSMVVSPWMRSGSSGPSLS